MKTIKTMIIAILLSLQLFGAYAAEIVVTLKNGKKHTIEYFNYTIKGRGIEMDNGSILEYEKITSISTSDYDAYEKASKIISRNETQQITLEYTGKDNVKLTKLKRLQEKREGAHVARGAGGLMALIGAFSGDRDLYNAGMLTYGAGTIAKDINTENTIATQNQMLNELYENQSKKETTEEKYRREYGNENVDAVIALLENDHKRASALANAGETSKDANYRLSALYVKAMIAVDMNNSSEAKTAYEKIAVFDPEIADAGEAEKVTKTLTEELNKLRNN